MVTIIRTDSDNPDFRSLVALLDADLARRDGDEHAFYAQFNKVDALKHVLVGMLGETPIACGAFKQYDHNSVEVKRMFVQPEHRGKGYAQQILRTLENWAAELNYTACILETGKKQPEAINLYERAGYHRIKNYGQYEHIENSVCMRKELER